jgi:type IV secretory pathway VirB10-like protein
MGNIIEKVASNTTEILSGATLISVVGYMVYEACEKRRIRDILLSKKHVQGQNQNQQAVDFISQMNQVYLKDQFNTH